jgi:hypothetical protein
MGTILKNLFRALLASASLIAWAATAAVPAAAQNSNTAVPREPTTKDGKCAKANGGTWNARRNGWYTNDRLNYNKCMSGH